MSALQGWFFCVVVKLYLRYLFSSVNCPVDQKVPCQFCLFQRRDLCARVVFRDSFWMFFVYKKKFLGQTEMRTRDRMCCQSIRTLRDISRDARARIATWSLLTVTDRQT